MCVENYGLVNGVFLPNEEREKAKKQLRTWARLQTEEELQRVLGSRTNYKKYGVELCHLLKINLPQSYQGLITLLGGDPYGVSQAGKYLLGLLESTNKGKPIGESIADRRNLIKESRENLTGDRIREIYGELPDNLKEKFFKNENIYHKQIDEIRKHFGEGIGSSFDRLIKTLGGDNDKSRSAKYVKALMISPEEGEKYLEEKQQKKLNKKR